LNSEPRTRQSQSVGPPVKQLSTEEENSSSNSDVEFVNNRDHIAWKRTGFQTVNITTK
jgi:hypothetical protein